MTACERTHDDVDEEVDGDDDPLLQQQKKADRRDQLTSRPCEARAGTWATHDGGGSLELGVAEHGGGRVMEHVQEGWGRGRRSDWASAARRGSWAGWRSGLTKVLLLEDEEDGVEELVVLDVVVDDVVKLELLLSQQHERGPWSACELE